MDRESRSDEPELLVKFVQWFESDGSILCVASSEEVACCLRSIFKLPAPMELPEASQFIGSLKDISFYLQPGLESAFHIKGVWFSLEGTHIVLVEPTRPDASRIKTVFHEIAEQLLAISHDRNPKVPKPSAKRREQWANQVAAFVKMPSDQFRARFALCRLDLELLKDECKDTLAGVARHVRDLELPERPYYFCRFEIVHRPERVCPVLLPVINATSGPCVVVRDLVRTELVNTGSVQGSLPLYNLPVSDHYRVMNPIMNRFIDDQQAVFFSSLDGGASEEGGYRDLFGDQQLCALLIPYGKRRTRGFFMIAVHPNDRELLNTVLSRTSVAERGDPAWLFSRASYVRKRARSKPDQGTLPGLNGDCVLNGLLPVEPYPWPESSDSEE